MEILKYLTKKKCPVCKRDIIFEDDGKISFLIKILTLSKYDKSIIAKCIYCKNEIKLI
jgi:hypothetical protein